MNQLQSPATPVVANDTAYSASQTIGKWYVLNIEKIILMLFIVCACATLVMACTPIGDPAMPTEGLKMPVEVLKSGNDLKVTNNTDREVFFFACPERLLPVITWTSVVNPLTATNRVSAKSSKNFPQSQFSLRANDAVHVAWWHLGQKINDSLNLYNADSVRGLTVSP